MIIYFQTLRGLIEVPYSELATNIGTFLDGIDSVSFQLKDNGTVADKIQYELRCGGIEC